MSSLIFLPGLACDAEVWTDVLAALPPAALAGRELHVSDVHRRHDTLPQMAAALLAEHPGPLTLVGHSMGGMVAMHAATQAPERLRALALLGTTARADTPELIRLRTDACALFAAGRADEVLRANVLFAFHPDFGGNSPEVKRYLALVGRAGADQLIRQNHAVMARADLRPLLARIRCPTLVATGEGDALTPPEVARELAAAITHAALHIVPRCGHMLTLEQPAAVAALLAGWLAERPA